MAQRKDSCRADVASPNSSSNSRRRIVDTYDYTDEAGELLYQVVRYAPKDFRQRRPDGKGGWIYDLEGVRRVLYRLPNLARAPTNQPVFVPEGEKDVDRLLGLGLLATTNAMGAGKWRPEYNEPLRGRRVFIVADNDDAGRKHAQDVRKSLRGIAASVTVVELEGLPPKGDVSDWLDIEGNHKEKLLMIAAHADHEQTNKQTDDSEYPEAERGDAYESPTTRSVTKHESQGDAEPWERPIPLGDVPSVAPFPEQVLPASLATFVREAACALACPTDYIGVPLLTIAGAAIGASRALEIKPGWQERPCLYAAIVAPPGSAKSPALKLMSSPVYAKQARLRTFYDHQRLAFEEDESGKLPKPKLSTIYVSDITIEALAGVLLMNARGVALIRDELTAWVAAMDQYRAKGRGGDRQFFLANWAGEPVFVHRKNQEEGPVFVPHPFTAVVGCVPPDLLFQLRGEKQISDGFFDRILFAYPEPAPVVGENWLCISDETREVWSDTLAKLWGLQQETDTDGGDRPRFVRLTSNGRVTHQLAAEVNAKGFPASLRGPWLKMKGYCARLSLILQLLRQATGETASEDVDGESIAHAVELVRYFQSQTRKVYTIIEVDYSARTAKRLLEWILREKRTEFKRWEPYEDLKNDRDFARVADLDAPLSRLVTHNTIRPKRLPERKGPGRPPASVYEVNPTLMRRPANPVNPENSMGASNSQDLQDSQDGF